MNKTELINQIRNTLSGQRFADWYMNGRFEDYITGNRPALSQKEINDDIERLFDLEHFKD